MQYVFLTIFASALWGSWMQSTKHLKDFPIEAFILVLYTTSLILVWGVLFVFQGSMIPGGIGAYLDGKLGLALMTIICGGGMSYGLLLNTRTMQKVGMILVTSISSVVSTILGLLISVVLGGLPSTISITRILLALLITLSASFACQFAGIRRDVDLGKKREEAIADRGYIIKVVIANVLVSMYVVGYSLGTKTPLNPDGFPPILCVALLATGSFLSIVLATTRTLIKNGGFLKIIDKKYRKQNTLGVLSGLAHYGGNILNIIATPALSAPISFLLGKTADFWTYSWGLAYGEFGGAKLQTKLILYSGFGLYIIGIFVLVSGLYS